MEVTVIKWDEIPQKDWIAAITSIPVGAFLKDLPYKTLPYAPSVVIPYDDLELPRMGFDKHRCTDGTFIWKRTQ